MPDTDPPRPLLLRPGLLTQFMPAVLYLLAIFYAGTTPPGPSLALNFWSADKVLHCLGFGGLQLVLYRAFDWLFRGRAGFRRTAWLAVAASTGAGAALEIYQATLPYRSADLLDLLADAVGAVLALGLHALVRRLFGAGEAQRSAA